MVCARCLVVDEDPGRWARLVRVEEQGVSDDRRSRLRWLALVTKGCLTRRALLSVVGRICWARDVEEVRGICGYVKTSRYWNKEAGGMGSICGGEASGVVASEHHAQCIHPFVKSRAIRHRGSTPLAREHVHATSTLHCLFGPVSLILTKPI